MAADSSAAGYLRPSAGPPYGEALQDIFQAAIVGITGIAGKLVRPKFQRTPPNQPGFDVDWCAYWPAVLPTVFNAYKAMLPDGTYVVQGTEVIVVTCSFYGPNYQEKERSWRDGLQVGQNLDDLIAAGITYQFCEDPAVVPVLLKEQWVQKADVKATFHRWASRTYPVLSFTGAEGTVVTDQASVPIVVTPDP